MYCGAGQESRRFAKLLRKEMTAAEKLLWQEIRNRKTGFKFRRQHPLGIYIADFFCNELKLVIELDGGIHTLPGQKEKDVNRSFNLELMDLTVIRFTNEEVQNDLETVFEDIKTVCNNLKHRSSK